MEHDGITPPPPHDEPGSLDTPSMNPTAHASDIPTDTWPEVAGAQVEHPTDSWPIAPSDPSASSTYSSAKSGTSTKATVAIAALVASLVGGGVGAGTALLVKDDGNKTIRVTTPANSVTQQNGARTVVPRLGDRSDIHELIKSVQPAVVAINVVVSESTPFGDQEGEGAGTGFVISPDGIIVTNNHVVEGATKVTVHFQSGDEKEAEVLGTDRFNDLAVIKVDAKDLPTLALGSSADMRVGDDVVAIGNALALEGGLSVTRGIISGLDRTLQTDSDVRLTGLLQTDASINPGNSGGPLVNAAGEVVGINTAIASPDQTQNVGFAISIDNAKRIIDELAEGVTPEAGYLGVRARSSNTSEGAIIASVESGSPADKAGMEAGDEITEIDGTEVTSFSDVVGFVKAHRAGDTITIKVLRDDETITLEITLGNQPAT